MEQPRFEQPFEPVVLGDDHRHALRRAVKMRAHLRDRGQTRFEIDVVDLSQSGFRAETSFTLWPGTVVWLTMPGLAALEAVVAWRDKFKYGCAFAKRCILPYSITSSPWATARVRKSPSP